MAALNIVLACWLFFRCQLGSGVIISSVISSFERAANAEQLLSASVKGGSFTPLQHDASTGYFL